MKSRIFLVLLLVFTAACQSLSAKENLSRAAIAGDINAAKDIVKSGEGVNEIDKWGWTPLMWAVYYGKIPVVDWLLEQGADPNIKSEKDYGFYSTGTTALILAASYDHPEAVNALLKKNADVNYVDKSGKKAVDYAREYGFERCVAILEKK